MAPAPYQFAGEGPVGDVKPENFSGQQQIRATPEAFGAARARATQQIGKTAEELGAGALRLSQFYDQVAVDDGANKLQESLDRLKHGNPDVIGEDGQPETGFMGKRGALAMDHYKPTLTNADEAVNSIRESLPAGQAQTSFDRVARGMMADFKSRIGSHYEQQSKEWAVNVNKATLTNSLTAISREPDSEEVFNHSLADGFDQAGKNVHLAGGGETELKAAKDAVLSAAWKTRIASIGVNEPKRALQMAEEHKADLGMGYDEVAGHLRARADEQAGNMAGAKAFAASHGTHAAYNPRQPIFAQAATQGPLSRNDLARFVQIEWPGRNNPKNPSHQGPGQFSESTARQVGITDRNDFGQAVMGIQRYAAMNAPILARALGRMPSGAELYLAHQQGPGGAAKLLANPDVRAGDLVGDAAIKQNGGNPNAPASAFTSMWVRKFGGNVSPSAVTGAGGGIEIPEFASNRAERSYMALSQGEPSAVPDIISTHPEQVRADALRSIIDDQDLNDDERRHAIQTINQLSAAEEIADHAAEKAKKEMSDAAANEFAQMALTGKFEGLVDAISSDPRLTDWHTRASLVGYVRAEAKRQATGEDEGYGKGYAQIYHRVVARPGDPERIADPAEIYRLADEGGPLTGNGAAKLAAILREIKRPESASAHTTFSQIMNEAKKEVSFEQVYGDFKIPDTAGERNYAYRIFPEMQGRFDRLMREGGDTQKFFAELPQEVRKMRDSLRSPTEAARDRMAALGAVNNAETGPIPPAPPQTDGKKWHELASTPPLRPDGKPFKTTTWGAALTALVAAATPQAIEKFDASPFGKTYKGKELLDMLGVHERESMEGEKPDILSKAKQKYPFINQYNPAIKVSPRENGTFAETFPPGEEGAGEFKRPGEFPIDRTGIEVYRPDKFSEDDLAAEFLHVDPKAHEARAALIPTLTDHQLAILRNEPDYQNIGGNLSDQKQLENVVDAMMRGYTVGQWPKQAIEDLKLTDKQREILNNLKKYMTAEGER